MNVYFTTLLSELTTSSFVRSLFETENEDQATPMGSVFFLGKEYLLPSRLSTFFSKSNHHHHQNGGDFFSIFYLVNFFFQIIHLTTSISFQTENTPFKKDVITRFWFTYRQGFEPIGQL